MYIPRYYQNEAVESIFLYYAGKDGNPVVAMPTASGKSLVIAEFIKTVLHRWPRQRIICCTHVKELIEQNAEKIKAQWPAVPLGIYSAGLKQKDTHYPVIYGGIGSVANNVAAFGWRDLMIVDEAHLIGEKDSGQYLTVIAELRKINPNMKVIGFTATHYRTGQGLLTEGKIFTDICYNLCDMEGINKLIKEGFLCMLMPKRTKAILDVSHVPILKGEFEKHALQKAVDKDPITFAACQEIVQQGWDRKAWLIFASGVDHSDHIAATLQGMGIEAASVHSKMPQEKADARIKAYKLGKLQAIVNYGKLTTGFDYPPIDLIGDLRPTMSTVLHVQKMGRGMRPSVDTHKENCLVLDFARNTPRLGPINDPVIPRKRIKGQTPGVAPVRICDACGCYNHARATVCEFCGAEFPKTNKLTKTAGTDELIRTDAPIIESFDVNNVSYAIHYKKGFHERPTMKVVYSCGLRMFSEYVCFEHQGFQKRRAWQWWLERMGTAVAPPTTSDALAAIAKLRKPRQIKVKINQRYPEVLEYVF